MIYINQPLQIQFTDTDGADLSGLNLRVDYWAPSKSAGDAVTGTVLNANITVTGSVISWTFAENTLNAAGVWRYQVVDDTNEIPWQSQTITVLNRGW